MGPNHCWCLHAYVFLTIWIIVKFLTWTSNYVSLSIVSFLVWIDLFYYEIGGFPHRHTHSTLTQETIQHSQKVKLNLERYLNFLPSVIDVRLLINCIYFFALPMCLFFALWSHDLLKLTRKCRGLFNWSGFGSHLNNWMTVVW